MKWPPEVQSAWSPWASLQYAARKINCYLLSFIAPFYRCGFTVWHEYTTFISILQYFYFAKNTAMWFFEGCAVMYRKRWKCVQSVLVGIISRSQYRLVNLRGAPFCHRSYRSYFLRWLPAKHRMLKCKKTATLSLLFFYFAPGERYRRTADVDSTLRCTQSLCSAAILRRRQKFFSFFIFW